MTTNIVPLPAPQMAAVAPNWTAMRTAIAMCERIDEIKSLSDKATALRAYFAQSSDVENEVAAMRVRLRAERRLGEMIAHEQDAGRLATPKGDVNQHRVSSSSTPSTLSQLGIPRDRSARAQELARVPEEQFEAALQQSKPSARAISKLAPARSDPPAPRAQPHVDVRPVLKTWGTIRDFAAAIADDSLLAPDEWRKHPGIQAFQIAEIDAALPRVLAYLNTMKKVTP